MCHSIVFSCTCQSCLTPTALHLQVVSIGCIMGSQHCTPQHDQPQVTPHTLSVTYGTASIRLCHRPTEYAYNTAHCNFSPSQCLRPTALHTARHSQGRVTSFGRYLIQLKQVCLSSHKISKCHEFLLHKYGKLGVSTKKKKTRQQ